MLIVEDGSIVAGANTYIDVAYLQSFADLRGVTLPANSTDIETLIIKSADYVEAFRERFKGSKIEYTQPMQWPRQNVTVDGFSVPGDSIPTELQESQAQAALESNTGQDLSPSIVQNIKRKKIDVLETEYFGPQDGVSSQPTFPKVDAYLDPLLDSSGGTGSIRFNTSR